MQTKDQDPEAIISLACPVCDFALNMRRKHVGLKGKCISCSEPIRAVEESGEIVVKWDKAEAAPQAETKVAHEVPAQSKTPAEPQAEAKPQPQPEVEPQPKPDEEMKTEPVSEPVAEPENPVQEVKAKPESKWGFPDRPSVPGEPQPPTPDPEAKALDSETPPKPAPSKKIPADGFFDDLPSEVSKSPTQDSAGSDDEESSDNAENSDNSPRFGDGLDDVVSLFDFEKDDDSSVNTGWGTKVPNETHASISPFSTGSAESDGGFAETLFREGVDNKAPAEKPSAEKTTSEKPKNALFSDDSSGGMGANALFGSGATAAYPSTTPMPAPPKKSVQLNEDGHELRPLSPEEEEEMAKTMLGLQNDRDKRSMPGWMKLLKKLSRVFAVLVILMGIGYGTYVVMPEDKAEKYKEMVMEWLEPGMVIFDYLPGKDGEKSKGFQELDKLKGNVNDYYKESQNQVNSTLNGDGEGYDFDEDRGGSGNDENATGLDQLDKLKGDIQGYQKRSQDEMNSTYDGESGLDFDEGRPPEVMEKLKDSLRE